MNRLSLFSRLLLGGGTLLLAVACGGSGDDASNESPQKPVDPQNIAEQERRQPWHAVNPEKREAAQSVRSEEHKLEFFGWGEGTDKRFQLEFPASDEAYDRVILSYRMGGWGKGPGDWDNTTMLFVENKADGEWYEIARAFTPFGGSFDSSWSKTFYLDVTEYLPMLQGKTNFRLYYGGFDATAEKAHSLTVEFLFYEGTPERKVVYTAKVYDSSRNGNSGYRGWCYGVPEHDIEDAERLGERSLLIPAEVKSLEMKVSISGHGHDQGTFLDRRNYRTKNAAEFDENYYTIRINGVAQRQKGHIFYSNAYNYNQAGTYYYDRANWAPGNPLNVQYWTLVPQVDAAGRMSIDLDLERFQSVCTKPNEEGVAQYIVEVDLFGYDR